jgi:hypothetical protein
VQSFGLAQPSGTKITAVMSVSTEPHVSQISGSDAIRRGNVSTAAVAKSVLERCIMDIYPVGRVSEDLNRWQRWMRSGKEEWEAVRL